MKYTYTIDIDGFQYIERLDGQPGSAGAKSRILYPPTNEFEKWATVEVSNFNDIPGGMESFTLPGGLYAVFDYKGAGNDDSIFQYIFMTWLPKSAYKLDHRPHFEVLGENYRNNDPNSEEEIWIPIKQAPYAEHL